MTNPIRLAIVDDHEMVRQTWKMILQRHERIDVVAECASGQEAIDCAETIAPDVMLMDINMKPINGFEATRQITDAFPDIKIIGVSINNQTAYARNMLQMGASGYVTKNSPSEEMLTAIFTVFTGGTYLCEEIRESFENGLL